MKQVVDMSLRQKVNGAILVTFVLIALIFSSLELPFQQQRLQDSIKRIVILVQTLVERDQEQLANEIFDLRMEAIKIRLEQMMQVEGILAIAVYDTKGNTLSVNASAFSGSDLKLHEPENKLEQPHTRRISWQGGETLLYTQEIRFLGERLGVIQVYYSLADLYRERRFSFLIFGGLLGSILLVMLLMLNIILSRTIITPIQTLKEVARSIAGGNLDQEIRINRQDEIGELAQGFADMRDSIKEKIADLQRLTKILESTSDLVSISTPDLQIKYINRSGRAMLGFDEEDLLANKQIADLHPRWALKVISRVGLPAAIAQGIWEGETAIITAERGEIPVSQVIMSHKSQDTTVEYFSTIMRDISERKRAEKELLHLRNYLTNIFNSMPSLLIGVTADGKVSHWNRAAEQETGIQADQAVGRELKDVYPSITKDEGAIQKAIQSREPQEEIKVTRVIQNRERIDTITVFPLVTNGMEGAVIRIDDITEKVKLEEMIIQTEKMLSVGGLAAGMAHEINNPLAGILQNMQVMQNRFKADLPKNRKAAEESGTNMETIVDYLQRRGLFLVADRVIESGRRASQVVENMLSFARKGESSFSKCNLIELLDKTVELAESHYDLKKNYDFRQIRIIREYETDIPEIDCESSKIQQVILNILNNGAMALFESNRDDPILTLRVYRDEDAVTIEIGDNGPGMTEEIRRRVFEPFFTTRPVGRGTGLGLSVSYFIVRENHGGSLTVESSPGKGASFKIRLPLQSSARWASD